MPDDLTRAVVTIRDSNGREWLGACLILPLTANDGSGDRIDALDLIALSPAIVGFKVVDDR